MIDWFLATMYLLYRGAGEFWIWHHCPICHCESCCPAGRGNL